MGAAPPPAFGEGFLEWLRIETEKAWESYEPRDFSGGGVGGLDWQPGTVWQGGLEEDEIDAAEAAHGLVFPDDWRLFLRRLHAPDLPQKGMLFSGQTLVPAERPHFHDWRTGGEAVRAALEWPLRGLTFDVERNALWLPGWGPAPSTLEGKKARLAELVGRAPRLVPVCGHRYLLAEPRRAGNPVFSIYQADLILYGSDLRSFLLVELADVLGIDPEEAYRSAHRTNTFPVGEVPFWGELLHWNNTRP